MTEINEKAILEWVGFVYKKTSWPCDPGYPDKHWHKGHKWFDPNGKWYKGGNIFVSGGKPNIYSLDWQKEYLGPKLRGEGLIWDMHCDCFVDKTRQGIWFEMWPLDLDDERYKNRKKKRFKGIHKDPATAILLAVMELIGGTR